MDFAAGFAGIPAAQIVLVGVAGLFTSIIGGVTGYGTGVLMPLVLVPIAGAETVVPIIAITALFNNTSRAVVFRAGIDRTRALIVVAAALPTCVLGAYGFTRLTGRGALIVIGLTLILSVPLRRMMISRGLLLDMRGLALGAVLYGVLVGGTTGSGIILLSMLLAAGLAGAAVIATDAVISLALGVVKTSVFGIAGALTPKVVAFALMIGVISLPGAFIAKKLVERLPVRVHTAILDAVVLTGGAIMIGNALMRGA